MRHLFIVLLTLTGANASIINGGFENGLAGWQSSGSWIVDSSLATADTSAHPAWTAIGPCEGSFFCLLKSGNETGSSQISQEITFIAGNKISLAYYFATSDYVINSEQFNDNATIILVSADGSLQNIQLAYKDVASVPAFGSTPGWLRAEHIFNSSEAGTYVLTCKVEDACDKLLSSWLAVDDVIVNPEPASFMLLSIGSVLVRLRSVRN